MSFEEPGCFGMPSAVSARASSCHICAYKSRCVSTAFEFLESLPDTLKVRAERLSLGVTGTALLSPPRGTARADTDRVVASSRGVRRIALGNEKINRIAQLPPRVASQVRQMTERGWVGFARSELRLGRNPATKGWKQALCAILLQGGGTRSDLELALVSEGLTPASAKVQASFAITTFTAIGLISVSRGRIDLNPNGQWEH